MKSKKPCPWCKCNDVRVLSKGLTPEMQGLLPGHQVECTNCGARGPSGYVDTANAIGAWEGLDESLISASRLMEGNSFSGRDERIYESKLHVISREFGLSPNAEMFGGQWVVRNVKTGEYVEHSAHRHDMIEKYS